VTTPSGSAPTDAAAFVERLLLVLEEGRRTGTHKLVLLLGLIRATERATDRSGGVPPPSIPVADVCWHILDLLVQHVAPFVPAGGGPEQATVLRQMRPNGRGAFVFHEVAAEARALIDACPLPGLDALRTARPEQAADLERRLVSAAVKNPLPRFQRLAGGTVPFLYDWPWPPDTSPSRVAAEQGEPGPLLVFRPGAAALLLRFAPLLRPLVEERYGSDVARYNGLDAQQAAIRDHLFGSARLAFPTALRDALGDLQGHRCLYCEGPLAKGAPIDHFVPWIRHPNNALENLVLVDVRCNSSKSDLLAGSPHIEAWLAGVEQRHAVGRLLAPNLVGVLTDRTRSLAIARRAYDGWPDGLPLWTAHGNGGRMDDVRRAGVRRLIDAHLGGTARRRAAEPSVRYRPEPPQDPG
jgi:5-methylcytosine-specific restriction endonuclease McrA